MWVRIDDQMTSHPKIVKAGPEAGWLFVCGLTYAAAQLTDGYVPKDAVPMLSTIKRPIQAAEKLVEAGLWERETGGYRVHDYHDYQPSAAQVRGDRETNRRRKLARNPAGKDPESGRIPETPYPGPSTSRTRPKKTTSDGESGDTASAAAADPPGKPTNGKAQLPADVPITPLVAAFEQLGIARPRLNGSELANAVDLLKDFSPGEIARCWQDYASGEYGDDFDRRHLSFKHLAGHNRLVNWQRERSSSAAADEDLVGHVVVRKV